MSATARPALPLGIQEVDQRLAAAGLGTNQLHEFAAASSALCDDAAATLFVAGLAARFAGKCVQTVWVVFGRPAINARGLLARHDSAIFYRMSDNGPLDARGTVLVALMRVAERREAEPTEAIMDNQSVKPTAAGGPRGYDAGKKIKARTCRIVTDTLGNVLEGVVHAAVVQDRNGAPDLIERSCDAYLAIETLFADDCYAGRKVKAVVEHSDQLTIGVIRRSDLTGLVVLRRLGSSSAPSLG